MERFDSTLFRAPTGAVFLALILAGCGDSGDAESTTASVQPTQTQPAQPAQPAIAAGREL